MHGHDLRRGDSRELPLSRRRLRSRTPLSPNTKPSVKHTGCQIQAAAGQALNHPGLRSASTALSVMNASASSRGWGGHCYSPQASAGQNIEFLVLSQFGSRDWKQSFAVAALLSQSGVLKGKVEQMVISRAHPRLIDCD